MLLSQLGCKTASYPSRATERLASDELRQVGAKLSSRSMSAQAKQPGEGSEEDNAVDSSSAGTRTACSPVHWLAN